MLDVLSCIEIVNKPPANVNKDYVQIKGLACYILAIYDHFCLRLSARFCLFSAT